MGKERNPQKQKAESVLGNIGDAYFGAWVPAPTKPGSLPEALKPHMRDIGGVPSVPARLLRRVNGGKL